MDGPSSQVNVLLVDDEDNILRSLRRLLRQQPYTVTTASSGAQALEILSQQPFDLVMSDARMPGMDGAELLAEVSQRWPDTIRILLTGFADMTTTIKAINEGRIYRYVAKPWNDEELKTIIHQALAHQFSERERVRLQKLTEAQNRELHDLNATLEQRVIARTEELQQTADMLDLAHEELKRSYVTTTEVFSSLINLRLTPEYQTNASVIDLVKRYTQRYELDSETGRDLSMAAALYNLGKLSWSDSLFRQPSGMLKREQRALYQTYPTTGEQLLMALDPLQGAARMIRHHQERWNGSGFPDRLSGEAIPFGARLLKIVVDYIEVQCGLITQRRATQEEALELLHQYAGRLYDPVLCERFIALCRNSRLAKTPADPNQIAVGIEVLQPGMELARDLFASSGLLLLNAGKVLTPNLIEKLTAFERTEPEGSRFVIHVLAPSKTQVESQS